MLTPIYEEYPDYHCLSHLNPQSSDLSLFSCGIQKCPPGHTWDKPRPQYHLHFIIDGKGTFQTNGKTWRLSRRQLFLCPPDTPVYYSADSEDPWHYAWVSVYGPKASLWLKQTGFDQDTLVRDSYIPVEQFTILIQQLLNTWKPAPGSELRQLSFLFHLMSLLISSNTAKNTLSSASKADTNEALFNQALEFISDNYDCNIHVQDISNYLGISRSRLCSLFQSHLNQSPQNYLILFRMQKAQELLTSTNFEIQDISHQIGYPDSQTFSKAFRRVYNTSPSEYQKLHSGKSL